jgi:hypothetical protein
MKLIIRVIVGIAVGVVVLVGIAGFIGSLLPRTHVASRSILVHRPPEEVYTVVRDFGSAPKWRSDVTQVEVRQRQGGPLQFREVGENGTVNYELVEDVPAQRIITRIIDTNLGYSGQWTYIFTSEAGGTRVTIREDGEVSNVLFRFMSRYVFGQTATIDGYLRSLAKHFGESATPQ